MDEIRLSGQDQQAVDVIREELEATLHRVNALQSLLVHTAMTFAGVPKGEWLSWEVGMGSPTIIRKKIQESIGEEVIGDE